MRKMILWRNFKDYKWKSVYVRYFGQLIMLIFALFAVFTVSIFFVFRNSLEVEISKDNAASLIHISGLVDMTMTNIYNQMNWVASDYDVIYFLNAQSDRDFSYNPRRITSILEGIVVNAATFVDSVHIYSMASDRVVSVKGGGVLSKFYDNNWYSEYVQNRDKLFWVNSRETEHKKRVLTAFYAVRNMGEHTGVVIANLDIESLSNLLTTDLTIYDKEGYMIFPFDESGIRRQHEEILRMDLGSPHSVISSYNGDKEVTTYLKSSETRFTYVSNLVFSEHSEKVAELTGFLYITITIGVLLCLALIGYLYSMTVRPVNKILAAIDDEAVQDKPASNEIDLIVNTISKTKMDNRKKDVALSEKQLLLAKAQITAMQAQIKPHFLINILNTIRFMAMKLTGGSNDVSNAINALLGLYQISLSDSGLFTSVSEELDHVTHYIELQKIRFKDKFDVEYDIEPETISMMSTKIVLQPIVENAITHGIMNKKGKGMIKIRSFIDGTKLCYEVLDNGGGMDEATLASLNSKLGGDYFDDFKHIGLKNVNQRLKMSFGDEYGVQVQSEIGVGTKVIITMSAIPN